MAARITCRLDQLVPARGASPRLPLAMRYSLLAPGKRFRGTAVLLLAGPGPWERGVLDVACAVEMVHAASLVFDDLPCMDDARQRRGQPTLHHAFDTHTAVLAGLALLSQAFATVGAAPGLCGESKAAMVVLLAEAIGAEGLCAGQELDLDSRHEHATLAGVRRAHELKTGALLQAALRLAGRAIGLPPADAPMLDSAATELGLAFQALDDLRDQPALAALFADAPAKDVGQDRGKAAMTSLLDLERLGGVCLQHLAEADRLLARLPVCTAALRHYIRAVLAVPRLPSPAASRVRRIEGAPLRRQEAELG